MHKAIFRLAGAVALTATGTAQAATTAAEKPCVTRAETDALIGYFAPKLLDRVSDRCAATLAPQGYVRSRLPALSAAFAESRDANWPQARAGFLKIASHGGTDDLSGLSDKALRPLIDEIMGEKLNLSIKPEECSGVETVLEALAPLSPAQTSHLVSALFVVVSRKSSDFTICQD